MEPDLFFDLKLVFGDPRSLLGIAFLFIWGTFWGSFLNVCIYRLPYGRSIVHPGSSCPNCGQPIEWWQNIPVVSYLLIKAKCVSCHNIISARYPSMEVLTGLMCAVLYHHYGGITKEFIYYFAFSSLLVVVFFIDLDHWLILDAITFPGIVAAVLGGFFIPRNAELLPFCTYFSRTLPWLPSTIWNSLFDSVAGALMGYLLFAFIAVAGSMILRQEAMGGGDVKFAAMIGAFLGGHHAMMAFMLSFFLGFIYALPMLIIQRKKARDPVPFGTFMAIAAFMTMLWGDKMADFLWNISAFRQL